MVAHFL